MKMKMDAIIKIEKLNKKFGAQEVLHDVTLSFSGGHIYGLVGRNGSGKSVLLKIICGLMYADKGKVEVNGRVVKPGTDIPNDIGAIIENPAFLPYCSGYRNLQLLASIRHKIGRAEIEEAMIKVGLDPTLKKAVGKYSLGMKQRLALAQILMEDYPIILLDEPMNGLDQEGGQLVRIILNEQKSKGKLIILATHIQEDMVNLCDEVYGITNKEVIREG